MACTVTVFAAVFILFFTGFQVGILAKLDIIIENQQEQLALMRQIAANSNHSSGVDCLEELNALTIDSVEGLLELDDKLSDNEFKKKMVIKTFLVSPASFCITSFITHATCSSI